MTIPPWAIDFLGLAIYGVGTHSKESCLGIINKLVVKIPSSLRVTNAPRSVCKVAFLYQDLD